MAMSFIQMEKIASNFPDDRLLKEFEQPGSTLPQGVVLAQPVIASEMKGRNDMRAADQAMRTSQGLQDGSVTGKEAELFRQGGEMQGGPPDASGMAAQQIQQQGVQAPPPVAPQGPPGMAYGGLVSLQEGGDPGWWQGWDTEIPYISGLGEFVTGSRSIGDAFRNPLRTAGHTALMAIPSTWGAKGAWNLVKGGMRIS